MAAAVALREAVALARPLGHVADPRWEHLARTIFLRIDRNGAIRNHDLHRATEEKGETPEAAAGLFPLTFDCSAEVERATLAFYLRLADEYVGAPMLSALLGVYAARLGDRERALKLFERGYADFVIDAFALTTEYSPAVFPEQPVAGPFTANLGSFLTSCVYGLSGIRIRPGEPESWCARPVTLPRGWTEVHVERVWARGMPLRLTARHGAEHAMLETRLVQRRRQAGAWFVGEVLNLREGVDADPSDDARGLDRAAEVVDEEEDERDREYDEGNGDSDRQLRHEPADAVFGVANG